MLFVANIDLYMLSPLQGNCRKVAILPFYPFPSAPFPSSLLPAVLFHSPLLTSLVLFSSLLPFLLPFVHLPFLLAPPIAAMIMVMVAPPLAAVMMMMMMMMVVVVVLLGLPCVYTTVKCGSSGHNIRVAADLDSPAVGMVVIGNQLTATCQVSLSDFIRRYT